MPLGEGRLTEPTTAVQPWGREPLFVPPSCHCPELVGVFGWERSGHSLCRPLLFDDLVGAGKNRGRHGESEGFGGLEIDDQFDLRVDERFKTSFAESGLTFGAPIDYHKLIELDAKRWELYNLKEDFAETNNLAEKERDRLIAMIGMWYVEAGKYKVLPIDSRGVQRLAEERPHIAADRKQYIY
jgi:hypothetical protein